jgi:hypothetical protein
MSRLLSSYALAAALAATPAVAAPAAEAPDSPAAATESGWGLARTPGGCMLHASSAQGTVLSIWGFAGQDKFAFLLQNREWGSLREGQRYDLKLDFLGVREMPVEAVARLDLDSDGPGYFFTVAPGERDGGSALIDALASAEDLEVSRDGRKVDRLSLEGSREAMAGLARCMAELWTAAPAAPAQLDKADKAAPVVPTA